MGRYRTINVDLNRQYRNDLNKNFEDIEKDIFGTESEMTRIEAESKERDNLITGTDVDAIIQRIDTSADNADVQAQHAKIQGDYAKSQGDYAKSQGDYTKSKGDYANEKAILADQAAANANTESSNLSQLKVNVTTATQNANTATSNANTAITNANNAATYATTQGDYAKREADRVAGMDVTSLQQRLSQHLGESAMNVSVGKTSNQSIPNASAVDVIFNKVTNGNGADFVVLSGNKITFTKTGIYRIEIYAQFANNPNGLREIVGQSNDISVNSRAIDGGNTKMFLNYLVTANTLNFATRVMVYQDSGAALNLLSNTYAVITKVGDL